ncbi:actin-related protein 7 [[Candida] jaroonii]|uniref:Actin-related protein 7 n=1 Tax=[Candida] jaroonii TaxID=467808 RepID=A0ACA9YEK8_9ASCO|nr:actin-related protein 7 [[Candida] jaroonii]
MYTSPPIVIDNGSDTTKAGFASEDLPSLVFNTNYSVGADGKVIVGDEEIDAHPENEVMTLMDNGLIYDFDNIIHNWRYVYDNLNNGYSIDPKDYPLTMTEQSWNTKQNKIKQTQIVFEELEVPIFSLVKKPLCQLYHMGRSNGLVVDIGSSTVSVTPVLDGIIQSKFTSYSKFGGDYIDANILNYMNSTVDLSTVVDQGTESYKNYQLSKKIIKEFKISMLNIAEDPINLSLPLEQQFQFTLKNFQLPNKQYVPIKQHQLEILEYLFQPNFSKLSPQPPSIEKPNSNGLSHFIISTLKNLESHLISEDPNNTNKTNEILRTYVSNLLITGNVSLLSGLTTRLTKDLSSLSYRILPSIRPFINPLNNFQVNDVNEIWDKKFNTWLGASNLSLMINDSKSVAMDNWFVTKEDYKEFGEDYIYEKFK